MFTLMIAQRLGLESDLILGLSLIEGVGMTIALMLLVERYLFSPIDPIPAAAKVSAERMPAQTPR